MGHVLLFGGRNERAIDFNDTWEWSGTNWRLLHPATAPQARDAFAFAYDVATREMVLFGGLNFSGRVTTLGDTWTFDGTTWTQRT
jgi:hypothetical protein